MCTAASKACVRHCALCAVGLAQACVPYYPAAGTDVSDTESEDGGFLKAPASPEQYLVGGSGRVQCWEGDAR